MLEELGWYLIDKNGDIDFPVLGHIKFTGTLSVGKLKTLLTETFRTHLRIRFMIIRLKKIFTVLLFWAQ